MTQASRYVLATFLLAAGATAIVPAIAQFAPDPQDNAATPETPKTKKNVLAARVGPDVNGHWVGELTQVGSTTPYKFEIGINRLETKYPDLNCTGKLTRVGQSKSYVFFVEVITQGQAEKGGRCPDGTITVARSADKLAVGWFGSVKENTIVAYGNLAKK
jgi:polyisoprenoid-binding protein YceI